MQAVHLPEDESFVCMADQSTHHLSICKQQYCILLYSSLRIAPKFWSIFDPVGISILGFLARFGPFRAIPRPDSDSGRSDLRFQHVRPQKIMKYVMFMKFQNLKTCFSFFCFFNTIEKMGFLANQQPPKPI